MKIVLGLFKGNKLDDLRLKHGWLKYREFFDDAGKALEDSRYPDYQYAGYEDGIILRTLYAMREAEQIHFIKTGIDLGYETIDDGWYSHPRFTFTELYAVRFINQFREKTVYHGRFTRARGYKLHISITRRRLLSNFCKFFSLDMKGS